ncbi:MAG: APC family permease [Deltaproteobacteria bacterium]|nr:APC family permease [Deltaproteobacteria bacterium]
MTERRLVRGLGFWGASSLVVGTIIGTGVFLKTSVMAELGGSPLWVLLAWLAAGALSLAGAMTYAELGAMYPQAGGEYVYLRRGYGPFMGYLYAWNRFWIATPGSIAAYAVGTAKFLEVPFDTSVVGGNTVLAIALVATFTAINLVNVRSGGHFNTVLTVMKVALVLVVAAGALAAPRGSWSNLSAGGGFPGWSAFGAMMLAALWAYDGWNNLPMAAGEVRDPGRNLPRAIVGGSLAVLAIYAVINLGYFHALPLPDVINSASNKGDQPAVAARVAAQFLGDTSQIVLALAMALCALSAMNGSMLTGARVPYAVARDRLAPAGLGALSDGARVPAVSVLVQGALACILALTSSFDQLTDAVVFASWLFYALNAGSVLMLRRREPGRARPFRVPGFPVVPVVFVALATLLLVNTVYTAPEPSAIGLGMTAIGALVYALFLRGRARIDEATSDPP